MVILVNLLMAAFALALIGMPFLKKSGFGEAVFEDSDIRVGRKELLFSVLGEIEFDYRMNKLDAEDYEELKAGYQREAIAVLDREDRAMELNLEKELVKKRKAQKDEKALEEVHE